MVSCGRDLFAVVWNTSGLSEHIHFIFCLCPLHHLRIKFAISDSSFSSWWLLKEPFLLIAGFICHCSEVRLMAILNSRIMLILVSSEQQNCSMLRYRLTTIFQRNMWNCLRVMMTIIPRLIDTRKMILRLCRRNECSNDNSSTDNEQTDQYLSYWS